MDEKPAATAAESAAPATHAGHAAEPGGHHVSLWVLAATLGTLLVLTFITVAATWVNFGGSLNLWIAMGIATVKATLVALYFMHLRYDRPFNSVILITALLFVLLFVGIALMDSAQYGPDVQSWRDVDPSRYAPELKQP